MATTNVEPQATLSPEEENEIAGGFNPHEIRLITEDNQLRQADEIPAPVPVPEKGSFRLISVLVTVGCILGIGAAVWMIFFGDHSASNRKPPVAASPTPPSTTPASGDDKLKAELAFSRQRMQLEQANKDKIEQKQLLAKRRLNPAAQVAGSPSSSKSAYTSPYNSRPSTSYQSSYQPSATRTRDTPSSRGVNPGLTNPRPEDPDAEWEKLAAIGQKNYKPSQGAGDSAPQDASPGTNAPTSVRENPKEQESIGLVNVTMGDRTQPQIVVMTDGERGILNRSSFRSTRDSGVQEILVGTTIAARVKVPLAWANGQSQSLGNGAIELTEPLLDKNGRVAFPEGTILIARAEEISAQQQGGAQGGQNQAPASLLRINVIGAVLRRGGEVKQIAINPRAMSVEGSDGGPVQAKVMGQRPPGLFSGNDLILGLVGGAAKVGQIMNQAQSTSTSSVNGMFSSSSTTTSTNPPPNIMGAVLDGGLQPIAGLIQGRIARRDAYTEQQRRSAPTYYVLPQGTRVVVVVESFMRLE